MSEKILPPLDHGENPDTHIPFNVICDGQENNSGRALFLISALHLCAPSLKKAEIHFVAPSKPDVLVAAEALAWDTGMPVHFWESQDIGLAMRQGQIAVTIGECEPNHEFVDAASQAGIKCLVALQFPLYSPLRSVFISHVRTAHDTRALADVLQEECRQTVMPEPWRSSL